MAEGEGVRSTLLQGNTSTSVDEREHQKYTTNHEKKLKTQEIQQKSSEINDLENEPRQVWRLHGVSGVPRDDN